MNPLTEQRVHLAGNPIKSLGELLLCFPLIIASLPRTAANALLLLVYWMMEHKAEGELGRWGQRDKGEGDLLTMHTVLARCTACATSVRLFCNSLFFLLPLSFFFSFSLYVPPSPPLASWFLF